MLEYIQAKSPICAVMQVALRRLFRYVLDSITLIFSIFDYVFIRGQLSTYIYARIPAKDLTHVNILIVLRHSATLLHWHGIVGRIQDDGLSGVLINIVIRRLHDAKPLITT